MEEITFSAMIHSPETETTLLRVLADFKAQFRVHVNLQMLEWVEARATLNHAAMHQQGPDVSEIGTTWIADQVGMNALRPFTDTEMYSLGGKEAFVPASWQTVSLAYDNTPWAIPWLAETYAIHYRKDLLQQAGVNAETAFQTHQALDDTAAALAKIGVDVPVELPLSNDRYGTLHALASWVWRRGGNFTSPDGQAMIFDQPAALEAMTAYFSLLRYLSPLGRQWMREKGDLSLFIQGKSAITFGTLNLTLPRIVMPTEVTQNWAAAPLPSPCFVGGSGLVVWKHSHHERAAVELVRYLTSAKILPTLTQAMKALPPRLEILTSPELFTDPISRQMAEALPNGRTYPTAGLWGIVEGRLVNELLRMAEKLLAEPTDDIRTTLQKRISTLAKHLNLSMESLTPSR
jgi:multiple sugar transport system substrate-binding protein